MTAKVKQASPAPSIPAPVVLFGIDSRGKPKGARFGKEHASLAIKAASQLDLKVLASDDPKISEIAAQLPIGRVHGNGRTFVPFIRQDLYEKLVAAAPNGNAQPVSPPSGSSGMPGPTSGGSPPNLPRNWQEIGLGDLVVANQSPEDGSYEAIVRSRSRTTCSRCAGAITQKSDRSCAIGCGLGCSFQNSNRQQKLENQPSPPLRQNLTNPAWQNRLPTVTACPRAGTTSMPDISYWPKTTVHGGHGGKPFRLRRPATSSSCAGVTNPAA